jgi:hypothetical protein
METVNKELLSKVIKNRLEEALKLTPEASSDSRAFKEAMDAVSKQIELDKIEQSRQEQIERMKMEHDKNLRDEFAKRDEARKDRFVQIGIFTAGLILSPLIETACKRGYAHMICEFEKDYTFTTTAGRQLSGLFRFKK